MRSLADALARVYRFTATGCWLILFLTLRGGYSAFCSFCFLLCDPFREIRLFNLLDKHPAAGEVLFVYVAKLELDEQSGTYVVSCRDLPLLNSAGDTVDDALFNGVESAVLAISIEMDERRMVPKACKAMTGEYLVGLPVLVTMKAVLHNLMIQTGARKAYLARRMNLKGPQVDRLFDVHHPSKAESVEHAIHQLRQTVRLGPVEVYKPNKPA